MEGPLALSGYYIFYFKKAIFQVLNIRLIMKILCLKHLLFYRLFNFFFIIFNIIGDSEYYGVPITRNSDTQQDTNTSRYLFLYLLSIYSNNKVFRHPAGC